jgi:hypothetical protein
VFTVALAVPSDVRRLERYWAFLSVISEEEEKK